MKHRKFWLWKKKPGLGSKNDVNVVKLLLVPECVKPDMITPTNHISKRVTIETTETLNTLSNKTIERTSETTEITSSSGFSTAM